MTDSWQSAVGLDFSDLDSRHSSSTRWRHSRSTVPIGTVASRILDLQKLAQRSISGRSVSSSVRHQEQFKTGFGRRSVARFGQPASLSTKPDEQVQIDDGHSFLGLTNPRASHAEAHALVGGRSRWERTAGIHAQLQPSGLDKRVQYEPISPWAYLLKSKSYKGIKNNSDRDGISHADAYNSPTLSHMSTLNSRSQDTSAYDAANRTESGQKARRDGMLEGQEGQITLKKWHADKSNEGESIETTSTMRRQSVRDLYRSHGIERPAGLLSSEDLAFDPEERPIPGETHASCEVCLCPNDQNSIYCKCGHLLHRIPDMPSAIPVTGGDGTVHSQQKVAQSTCQNLPSHVMKKKYHGLEFQIQSSPSLQEQTKFATKEGRQTQEGLTKSPVDLKHKRTDASAGLPATHVGESTICRTYPMTGLNDKNLTCTYSSSQKPGLAPEDLNGSSISPLGVTSTMSSIHSTSFIPIPLAVSSHHKQRIQPVQRQKIRVRRPLDLHLFSSVVLNADHAIDSPGSPDHQAVYPDHQGQAHSITCQRKRPRHHDDTDSGYMGGVSHHDEFDDTQYRKEPCCEPRDREHRDNDPENNHKPSCQSSIMGLPAVTPRDGQSAPPPEEINQTISQSNHILATTMSPAAISHACQKKLPELPTPQAQEQPPLPDTDMGHEHYCHRFDSQPIISGHSLIQANAHSAERAIPHKPPTTNSRRLSAFLQQQDQNVVPLLSKRLQEHQEELKRIGKLTQERIHTVPQRYCLHQVQSLAVDGSKEMLVTTLKEPIEHSAGRECQATNQDEMERDSKLIGPVATFRSMEQQEEGYECPCKQIAKIDTASSTQAQRECHSLQTIKDEKEGVHDVGIKGITVVIHLEGKEDVLLKANLSLGV